MEKNEELNISLGNNGLGLWTMLYFLIISGLCCPAGYDTTLPQEQETISQADHFQRILFR